MKIKYFQDTDTLYIEFRNNVEIIETKDFDENTSIDIDELGGICSMTIEHAKERANIPLFSYEQIAA